MKYSADELFKVYSDDEELDYLPEEYVQNIRNSKEYQKYSNFIERQIENEIEKSIDMAFDKGLVEVKKWLKQKD